MTLTQIKSGLITGALTITGIVGAEDKPMTTPTSDRLPFFVLDRRSPFLTTRATIGGNAENVWHFTGKFLFKSVGTGTVDAWDNDIEVYPARIVSALFAGRDLGGSASVADEPLEITVGLFEYGNGLFFGCTVDFNVVDPVAY